MYIYIYIYMYILFIYIAVITDRHPRLLRDSTTIITITYLIAPPIAPQVTIIRIIINYNITTLGVEEEICYKLQHLLCKRQLSRLCHHLRQEGPIHLVFCVIVSFNNFPFHLFQTLIPFRTVRQ